MTQKIAYEQVRRLVVELLATGAWGNAIVDLQKGAAERAVDLGLYVDPNPPSPRSGVVRRHLGAWDRDAAKSLYAAVEDIVWDLIIEGILRPGLGDTLNPSLPFLHVSEWGKHALTSAPPTPYDPDGYLAGLKGTISKIDDVILTYLVESLHTFRINCLLSSTITLGCAAEKALLLLIEAYAAALPTSRQPAFIKATEHWMISRKADALQQDIDAHSRPKIRSAGLEVRLDTMLLGVFTAIRIMRNDAGHPTGVVVTRDQAYTNLNLFPGYLLTVYGMIDWLKTNPL